MAKWSIAKLLTEAKMFHGVGAYLRSEIIARITVPPWKECGLLELTSTNILVEVMKVYTQLVQDIQKWYP